MSPHQEQSIIFVSCGATALREELRLRVFENRVVGKIFALKWDEVTGEWRRQMMRSFMTCTPLQISFG
jgi:hypothetical protein